MTTTILLYAIYFCCVRYFKKLDKVYNAEIGLHWEMAITTFGILLIDTVGNDVRFKECIKIETTGQGSVWRGILNNQNVIIKSALRIYCNNNNGQLCENIMNEINILKDINKKGISGIINLIDIIEEDKYYCMVLEGVLNGNM